VRAVLAGALALGAAAAVAACGGAPGEPAAAPPTAAPVPPGRSAPFALVPDSASERVVALAAAGSRVGVRLRLANASGAPRAFSLAATSPWIAVPARVRVPARSSVPLTAVIAVPPGTGPGAHPADVVARAGGDPAAPVSVRYASSVSVGVRVVAGAP
jgi:hypothetical protein